MEGSATLTMLTSSKIMNAAIWVTANARQRRGSLASLGAVFTVDLSAA
jgi:hypothetical protein